MSFVPLIIVGALAVGLAVAAIMLALQNSKLKAQIDEGQGYLRDTRQQLEATRAQQGEAQRVLASTETERRRLQGAIEEEQRRARAAVDEAQSALANERREKEEF